MRIEHSKIEAAHTDERRTITAIFNGDFDARQVKMLHIKRGNELGNHYHHYDELFYLLEGAARYDFCDLDSGERKTIPLAAGERVIIGPRVAHRAEFLENTIMIEATTKPYVSATDNDVRWSEW